MSVAPQDKSKAAPRPGEADGSSQPNQWTVILKIIELFGKGAPYLVIVGGAIFAVLVFWKQSQEQLGAASRELTNTYNAIGSITNAQLKNISEMTTQFSELSKRVTELERQRQDADARRIKSEDEFRIVRQKLQSAEDVLGAATITLGSLGSLVQESPELLRAGAAKPVIRKVLRKSEEILSAKVPADVKHPWLQTLLAFANLQGFVGSVEYQQKLASSALKLIDELREAGGQPAELDLEEVTAHLILGAALKAQEQFQSAVNATGKALTMADIGLGRNELDALNAKLRMKKAEALVQLGQIADRYQGRGEDAVRRFKKAIDTILDDENEETLQEPERLQAVAGIRIEIAGIEIGRTNLSVADRESEKARQLMERMKPYVYRRDDWLDRYARIYNVSALHRLERVRESIRALAVQNNMEALRDNGEIERNFREAFEFLDKAGSVAKGLAGDRENMMGQAVHAWSLHNTGEAKLLRAQALLDRSDLEASISSFARSMKLRSRLVALAPGHREWRMDLRWTNICLNEAEAARANWEKRYADAKNLLDEGSQLIEEALKADPNADGWRFELARNRIAYAEAVVLSGQRRVARAIYTETRAKAQARIAQQLSDGSKRRWQQIVGQIEKALREIQ